MSAGMFPSVGCSCCSGPAVREVKILLVVFPWGFYQPFVDADTSPYRYRVYTTSLTNSTGNSTTVATYDEDSGVQDSVTTTDAGFDPDADKGDLLSHVVLATSDTYTYETGSYVITLSETITLAWQTAKAVAKLDSLVAVEDCKEPLAIAAWYDLGSGLEAVDIGWIFPSGTAIPTVDWSSNAIILYPNPVYPWDGKFVYSAVANNPLWFYSHYGWSGGTTGATGSDALNALEIVGSSPYAAPTDWGLSFGSAVASRSCHALPDGIGCGTTDVQDVVECVADPATEEVLTGACFGLELNPGWYCFDWTGIYSPGNNVPLAASWAEVTEPGWMVADEVGNGTTWSLNYTGPIPWVVDCCP